MAVVQVRPRGVDAGVAAAAAAVGVAVRVLVRIGRLLAKVSLFILGAGPCIEKTYIAAVQLQ